MEEQNYQCFHRFDLKINSKFDFTIIIGKRACSVKMYL